MHTRICFSLAPVALAALAAVLPGMAHAQQAGSGHGQNMSAMKFAALGGLPACTSGAVQQGDPAKEPSFILAKAKTGCVIPWHWHTPNEHLMIVAGTARVETKDGTPMMLTSGAFAMLPAKHVHRFTCVKACTMYVYSDAPFDIHYVDPQGQEITPEQALKAAK